jgi:hypothetical protein
MNTSDELCEQAISNCGKRLIPAVLLAMLTFLFTPFVFGETVARCDEASLRDALSKAFVGDGIVEFAFDCTITLTSPITIPAVPALPNGIVIVGAGHTVVISGGTSVSVFAVFAGGTLNMRNLTVAHGKATLEGGGILNRGNLRVGGCIFSDNSVTGDPEHHGQGGAIANHGDLVVLGSSFIGNSVQNGSGGAISSDGPGVLVADSLFSSLFPVSVGNSASQNGGAIYNQAGLLTIRNSRFIPFGFTPANVAEAGGAIYNTGTLNVINSSFSENTAEFGGGIINVSSGPNVVSQSTFYGNSTPRFGGAAINNGGTLSIVNSTFSNNPPEGVRNSGTLSVDYSTFRGDFDIDFFNIVSELPNAQTTLSDTMLFVANPAESNCLGPIIDAGYNLENQASCGFSSNSSLSNTNPDLGSLANNGGPTLTIAPFADSPAIDQIPEGTNGCGTPGFTDQRGVPRPQGVACDIGAYEVNQSVPQSAHLCIGAFTGAFLGDLIVSTGQTCMFLGGSITGNILLQDGTLNLSFVTVGGNIEATGGVFSIGPSTTINGNLEIHNYPPTPVAQNSVCGTTINGNLQVHNNAAAAAIGSAPEVCTGNTIGGRLEVHNNSAPVQVLDNTVTGDLDVHNNTGAAQVIGNVVTGELICQGNSSITGGPNPASKHVEYQCFQFTPN